MKWEEVIKSHDIRKMYQHANLESIKYLPKELIDLGKNWIKSNNKPSLFLTGCVGSGKTYFMTALFRAIVEQGNTWFRFTRSVDLFNLLLERMMEKKNNEQLLRSISEVPFLFIDDVGIETFTDRVKKEYFSIIDYRISEMLPFVFTSNLSKDKFGIELGERTASRLNMCMEIEFPGIDLRREINFFKI